MPRSLCCSLIAVLLLALPARADNLDAFIFGVDLDQFTTPENLRPTQVGFESLLRCTTTDGSPISAGCQGSVFNPKPGQQSGYLPDLDGIVFEDISFTPLNADHPDLWTDAHRTDTNGATIQISSLSPGTYQVIMLTQRPSTVTLETCFEVQGVDVGCSQYGPESPQIPLEVGVSYSKVVDGVQVGDNGLLDIFFKDGSGAGQGGWLNAIVIVPEPSTVLLLAAGLGGLVVLGRSRRRGRGSSRL